MAKLNIVELIKGVVLEQLYIVKVHWSCPLALLCKVQRLPLAKQSGYTFKEALTHKNTYYIVGCLELAVIFYPVHIFITIYNLFLSLETSDIVQVGINKLEQYSDQTSLAPAYTVAMCMSPHICIFYEFNFLWTLLVLNPTIKLAWHHQNSSEHGALQVKQHFIQDVGVSFPVLSLS